MPYDLAMSSELTRRQYHDRANEAADEIEKLRDLLREALDRETRYVLPMYRDINYAARVRRALGVDPNEHYKIEDTGS